MNDNTFSLGKKKEKTGSVQKGIRNFSGAQNCALCSFLAEMVTGRKCSVRGVWAPGNCLWLKMLGTCPDCFMQVISGWEGTRKEQEVKKKKRKARK